MAARGSYAKGRETREHVIHMALEVIVNNGYSATSLKEIAEHAGLTQAGLLHHFKTKENLFVEVLRHRDEVDRASMRDREDDRYPRVIRFARHNTQVPGLVQLFVSLAAAAADPAHPCHEFFRERDMVVHRRIVRDIERRQTAGTFDPTVNAPMFARALLALSDGLQAHWLLEPTVDLPGTLEALWDRFAIDPPHPSA